MSRVIKFRAYAGGEMFLLDGPMHMANGHFAMAGCVLMQFTGLLDKNGGKEIYEGDVVKGTLQYPQILEGREEQGQVEWSTSDDTCRFRVLVGTEDCGSYSGLQQYAGSLEVIGNIYEHPDLLKAEVVVEKV